ncbi:MAG TPA: alkaline phosphatase, partial [Hellea balneolensis]|nr:alkaline phosphatase [Hellea balneolensis]
HHATNAYRALSETQELSNAVALADKLTNDDDTLILVTADHSHVFTMAGYPKLGNPILGLVHPPRDDESGHGPSLDANGLPYTTLGYQNGPNVRNDKALTEEQVADKNYRQQTAIPRPSETHGGEDVALFAKGPGAENVHGVIDQYEIFNIMKTATDLKP